MRIDLLPFRGSSPAPALAAFLVVSAALLVAAPSARGEQIVRLDAAARERAGVEVQSVDQRSFGDQVRVVGQVVRAPGSTFTVKSVLDGRVETLQAAPGDRVHRGQVLLQLHSHELLRIEGEVLRAVEELKLAEYRLESGRQLYAVEGISRLDLQRREQEALAARLALQSAEAELEHLGYGDAEVAAVRTRVEPHPVMAVRAPDDGVVLSVAVERQGWVRAYDELLVIGDPGRLELELQLPPDEASGIAAGDRLEFLPVGRPNLGGKARVITQVPQVDPATRTLTLRAAIESGGDTLLPGVFVEGVLWRGQARPSPSVPMSAVTRLGGSDYVFVHRGGDTFEARPVVLGRLDAGSYELLQGAAAGERVAVAGVFLLKSALLRGEEGAEG